MRAARKRGISVSRGWVPPGVHRAGVNGVGTRGCDARMAAQSALVLGSHASRTPPSGFACQVNSFCPFRFSVLR